MRPSAQIGSIVLILLLVACGKAPFESAPRVRLTEKDPGRIQAHFAETLPKQFQRIDTLTFQYGMRRMSAIGVTDVDMEAKTFTVVGLNPMGIKLFDLSGDMHTVNSRFVNPAFSQHKNFAVSIAEDIRRIYFRRVPAPSAETSVGKYRAVYQQNRGVGYLTHIFSGQIPRLTTKRFYQNNRLKWQVQYFGYIERNGYIHPAGIYLKNSHYNYRLTVQLKEIRS